MQHYRQFSKPFFRLSFPRNQFINQFISPVKNIQNFEELLKQLWEADEEFQKFKFTLKVDSEGNLPIINCCVQKCRYLIRFQKLGQIWKITTFNNKHSHDFLEFSAGYKRRFVSTNSNRDIKHTNQFTMSSNVSYQITSLGFKPYIIGSQQSGIFNEEEIDQCLQDGKNKNELLLSGIQIVTDKDQLQNLRRYFKGYYFENDKIGYSTNQNQIKVNKNQFLKNAIIRIERHQLIKEQIKKDYKKNSLAMQIKVKNQFEKKPIKIFYASRSMLNNLKKCGKSIFIGILQYIFPKIPQFFVQQQYQYPAFALIFMGYDQFMRTNIFGIGVVGGVAYLSNQIAYECYQSIIQEFFEVAEENSVVIQSVLVRQTNNLFQILNKIKENNKKKAGLFIRRQLDKKLDIHNYKVQNPGLLFRLSYALLYHSFYNQSRQSGEFEAYQMLKLIKKCRQIEPIVTKISTCLNEKTFAQLINKFILVHCQSDIHFQLLHKEIIERIEEFCLIKLQGSHLLQNSQQIKQNVEEKIIGENPYVVIEDIQDGIDLQKQNQHLVDCEIGEKVKSTSEKQIETQIVSHGQSVRNQYFIDSQHPISNFIGFNLFVDSQQWLKSLIFELNITQKMGESIVKDYQGNQKTSLPKTSAELFFRELTFILNQNKAMLKIPNVQFLTNIGFSVYGSSSESHRVNDESLKILSKTVSLSTNWDVQKYYQYSFEENVSISSQNELSNILKRLPLYKLSMIHFSKHAHQLILTFEMMEMLNLNCYQIKKDCENESQIKPYMCSISKSQDKKIISSKNERKMFVIGRYNALQTVSKIEGKKTYWKCTCNFLKYMGLPCMHILKAFTKTDYNFSDCTHDFWKIDSTNL